VNTGSGDVRVNIELSGVLNARRPADRRDGGSTLRNGVKRSLGLLLKPDDSFNSEWLHIAPTNGERRDALVADRSSRKTFLVITLTP